MQRPVSLFSSFTHVRKVPNKVTCAELLSSSVAEPRCLSFSTQRLVLSITDSQLGVPLPSRDTWQSLGTILVVTAV